MRVIQGIWDNRSKVIKTEMMCVCRQKSIQSSPFPPRRVLIPSNQADLTDKLFFFSTSKSRKDQNTPPRGRVAAFKDALKRWLNESHYCFPKPFPESISRPWMGAVWTLATFTTDSHYESEHPAEKRNLHNTRPAPSKSVHYPRLSAPDFHLLVQDESVKIVFDQTIFIKQLVL